MSEDRHALPNRLEHFARNLRDDYLLAIGRSRRHHHAIRIDHRRGTAKWHAIIFADAIGKNDIALVFNRARGGQNTQAIWAAAIFMASLSPATPFVNLFSGFKRKAVLSEGL
jgi:hypothetical protein